MIFEERIHPVGTPPQKCMPHPCLGRQKPKQIQYTSGHTRMASTSNNISRQTPVDSKW